MANSYAIRSVSTPENFTKLTVSCWFKGKQDGTQRGIWGIYDSASTTKFFGIYYSSNGSLYAYWRQGGSGIIFTLGTMQKFNDPSAWYHLVLTMDTTLATAADRVKMYINGERVTAFEDSLDTITQDFDCTNLGDTNGRIQWGGNVISGTQYYWNGLLSHCHMCVGYAYQASSFGETDATTGEWKINTSPSVSYGTNGGFWFKDGNQLTDSSTNSNTLTVGSGTLTKTEDCPSNVFATLNSLDGLPSGSGGGASVVYSNGNTRSNSRNGSGEYPLCRANIFVNSGKWYWESKVDTAGIGIGAGVMSADANGGDFRGGEWVYGAGFSGHSSGTGFEKYDNSGTITISDVSNSGGIIGYALDLDNGTHSIYLNGVLEGTDTTLPSDNSVYFFPVSVGTFSGGNSWSPISFNFGNGYFGTTAVSSAGTNASGNGIFEYDVPTGYTALSTKGLNL
jgi:hypothetical protein